MEKNSKRELEVLNRIAELERQQAALENQLAELRRAIAPSIPLPEKTR